MNQLPSKSSDLSFLSAWQAQFEVTQNPHLKQQLLQREEELLPRFAEQYQKLSSLPRRMRRSLQRKWTQSLAGIALLFVLGQAPALAATINVNARCSLGQAITSANNNSSVAGCARGVGADTIVLPRGSTQTLTAVNAVSNTTPYGPTGLPLIRSAITIAGNNSTIRRPISAPAFRIFSVVGNGDLTLQRTTVTGGRSTFGAGGVASSGTATITNSTIAGNAGCGIENYYDSAANGQLIVTNSSVSRNTGCGIYTNDYATSTVTGSTISENGRDGIGTFHFGQTTVTNSTISGNGGTGIYVSESLARVTGSTIAGNSLSGMATDKFGGGGSFIVTNSTLSGNYASEGGGGVYVGSYSDATLVNTTVTGNSAFTGGGIAIANDSDSSLTLRRSLVSGNSAPTGPEVYAGDYAVVNVGSFNLFGHSNDAGIRGFAPAATDIVPSQDPNAIRSPTLAANNGVTRTHALVAGSPAIDAVTDGTCPPPARDQRGIVRSQDGNGDGGRACDIGAFERQ